MHGIKETIFNEGRTAMAVLVSGGFASVQTSPALGGPYIEARRFPESPYDERRVPWPRFYGVKRLVIIQHHPYGCFFPVRTTFSLLTLTQPVFALNAQRKSRAYRQTPVQCGVPLLRVRISFLFQSILCVANSRQCPVNVLRFDQRLSEPAHRPI